MKTLKGACYPLLVRVRGISYFELSLLLTCRCVCSVFMMLR